MRKIHLGFALVAVFAFSAFGATSAFAVSKILVAGAEPAAGTPIQVTGSLLLEDMGIAGEPDLLCSGIFDGSLNAGGASGQITELLTSAGGAGNLVECTEDKSICSLTALTDVMVAHLPWSLAITLNGSAYLAVFQSTTGKVPTYEVDCVTILGLVLDTCSGESSARLFTSAMGVVLGSFNSLVIGETWGAESQPANCSVGGTGEGLIESPEDTEASAGTVTSSGGAVSLSE